MLSGENVNVMLELLIRLSNNFPNSLGKHSLICYERFYIRELSLNRGTRDNSSTFMQSPRVISQNDHSRCFGNKDIGSGLCHIV